MGFYQLIKSQVIPASIDEVWTFISSPRNLTRITPDWKMFGQPHPLSHVKGHKILELFKETIQNRPSIEFHQLEWLGLYAVHKIEEQTETEFYRGILS